MNAPAWSRMLYQVSRSVSVLDRSLQILRDELLFAFLPPSQRSALTLAAYAKAHSYGTGGEVFCCGLFPWESKLLESPSVPRTGRILLAAAGGGRELLALEHRGYEVQAFEPVAELARSAIRAAKAATTVVAIGSYEDLVARAAGAHGPLDPLVGPFDFCVLGWGSLSHLTDPDQVIDVLRAINTLAPRAPVMASFFLRGSTAATAGGARALRRGLRRSLAVIGGLSVPEGLEFFTEAGFVRSFSREELHALFSRAGYDVAEFSEVDYPHALLLPHSPAG